MPFPAIALDQTTNSPQPLTILYCAGKPVREVITAPECTLPRWYQDEIKQKADTASRIGKKNKAECGEVARVLQSHGPTGKPGKNSTEPSPRRSWSSLRCNEGFLNTIVSGFYGRRLIVKGPDWNEEAYQRALEKQRGEVFDQEAFEEAHALTHGFQRPDPVWEKNAALNAIWNVTAEPVIAEPVTAQPQASEPAYVPVPHGITAEGINLAFEAYASPDGQMGDLEAALYAFGPAEGRLSKADRLIDGDMQAYLQPEDIIQDFVIDVLDRFRKGQYKSHDGRFHHWIAKTWSRFFSTVQTEFYSHRNHTHVVDESEFDDERAESEDRSEDVLYRGQIDHEIAKLDALTAKDQDHLYVARLLQSLDDPSSPHSKLHPAVMEMVRALAGGASKAKAAEQAGISEGYARLLFRKAFAEVSL